MSELEQMLQYLQRRITNLKMPSAGKAPPPPSGTIIPAGTIFYCRPSRLRALVDRLGGESNVQIMDTESTQGFCRGKAKPAAPWTNEVYPTDIGPSCAGIDSDTARISVATTNNCITPDAWYPLKMYQSDSKLAGIPGITFCFMVQRVLWVHKTPLTAFTYLLNYRASFLNRWGRVKDPVSTGVAAFPDGCFKTKEKTFIFTSESRWDGDAFTQVVVLNDFEEMDYWFKEWVALPGTSFGAQVWPDNEVCVIDQQDEAHTGLMMTPQTPAQCLPFSIKLFQVNSNKIEGGQPTPTLRYGGYDRKNGQGTGPAPQWNRFNLLQIKTINDVSIEIRSNEDASGSRRRNNQS